MFHIRLLLPILIAARPPGAAALHTGEKGLIDVPSWPTHGRAGNTGKLFRREELDTPESESSNLEIRASPLGQENTVAQFACPELLIIDHNSPKIKRERELALGTYWRVPTLTSGSKHSVWTNRDHEAPSLESGESDESQADAPSAFYLFYSVSTSDWRIGPNYNDLNATFASGMETQSHCPKNVLKWYAFEKPAEDEKKGIKKDGKSDKGGSWTETSLLVMVSKCASTFQVAGRRPELKTIYGRYRLTQNLRNKMVIWQNGHGRFIYCCGAWRIGTNFRDERCHAAVSTVANDANDAEFYSGEGRCSVCPHSKHHVWYFWDGKSGQEKEWTELNELNDIKFTTDPSYTPPLAESDSFPSTTDETETEASTTSVTDETSTSTTSTNTAAASTSPNDEQQQPGGQNLTGGESDAPKSAKSSAPKAAPGQAKSSTGKIKAYVEMQEDPEVCTCPNEYVTMSDLDSCKKARTALPQKALDTNVMFDDDADAVCIFGKEPGNANKYSVRFGPCTCGDKGCPGRLICENKETIETLPSEKEYVLKSDPEKFVQKRDVDEKTGKKNSKTNSLIVGSQIGFAVGLVLMLILILIACKKMRGSNEKATNDKEDAIIQGDNSAPAEAAPVEPVYPKIGDYVQHVSLARNGTVATVDAEWNYTITYEDDGTTSAVIPWSDVALY